MGCVGDWVCGVVCCGLWIGGVVYGVCEAEGVCAVCDLPDYFGGGGFVFCFADGIRIRTKSSHRGHRGWSTEGAEKRPPGAQPGMAVPHVGLHRSGAEIATEEQIPPLRASKHRWLSGRDGNWVSG